ncbi:MAG TPA: NAD(P)H-dependent oxidoreductase [Bacillota bacterium]|nr:NAD(P)H-dependent oxidoreductase [Bacillota bacterium]
MRIAILDGRMNEGIGDLKLGDILSETLRSAVVRHFRLREMELAPCLGCFDCWVKTPGQCIIPDKGRAVAEAAANSDVLVFVSPVTFGGYSSVLKMAVDRLIPNILPLLVSIKGETRHAARYLDYPKLLGIGISAGNAAEDELFTRLVGRNALNYHSPAHAAQILRQGTVSPEELTRVIRQQMTAWGVIS